MNDQRPGQWNARPPLVSLLRPAADLYELAIRPGADVEDLTEVVAALPAVVYLDHRPAVPADATVILTYRAAPAGADGVPVRPTARGGDSSGWVPTIDPTPLPSSAYEQALHKILTVGPYQRHGQLLVYGLAHADPAAVIAAADAIYAAWTQRR